MEMHQEIECLKEADLWVFAIKMIKNDKQYK
jgi:hypothetical protein